MAGYEGGFLAAYNSSHVREERMSSDKPGHLANEKLPLPWAFWKNRCNTFVTESSSRKCKGWKIS
jgi:hypothetical protein